MKISSRFSLTLLFCVLSSASLHSQTIEDVQALKQRISAATPKQLATQMESASPRWPRIETAYAAENAPKEERSYRLEVLTLGEVLFAQLGRDFDPAAVQSPEQLVEEVHAYEKIAEILRSTGGYTNWVLSDTVDRLIFYRLAAAFFKAPQNADKVKELLRTRKRTPFQVKPVLSELISQDATLAAQKEKIEQLKGDETFASLASSLNAESLKTLVGSGVTVPTSHLLKNPSGFALTMRLGITDALYTALFPGAIAFFDAGGKLEELDPSNNVAFKTRLGKNAATFKAPFLGMKYLDATRVKGFVDGQNTDAGRKEFVEMALK